mgnify:FL=1|tara:strand:- start:21983 stop:23830 length:1848 start_codon:yes stop_codon:yes gene_type:complete
MVGNKHEEVQREDSSNSSECYVEIVLDSISNRNSVVSTDEYTNIVLKHSWNKEMYRSYFVFDESFNEHVTKTHTVKGYEGSCALDYIILDIDKGEIPSDQLIGYIQACLSEIFDKGVMEEDINLWFSGSGFHIEMKNVFGLQQSKTLHDKLRLTMNKHFDFADSIYDKTRIIRTKWSLNPKTQLHKIWIPLSQIGDISFSDLEYYASNKQNYMKWVDKDSENFFETLHKTPDVEPYLQSMVIASPTIATKSNLTKKNTEVTSVVSCMQHIFNEGPHIGARNNKMMRMTSTYKRAGVPFIVALNGMHTWSDGQMSEDEVTRTVKNVYDGNYQYGCDDHIMAEYCDTKCVYYKRKDYKLDIKGVNELEDSLRDYLINTMSQNSIELSKIYGCNTYNLKPGELIVFSGDTGLGKTAFIQDIIVKAKQHTLFLSLEMNEQLIFRRFGQIAMGKDKEWINEQYKTNPDFTLKDELDHVQVMTIAPRIDSIKKVVSEYAPKVLVVDTTDEVQVDFVKGEIEKQNVVIGALKQIAQKTNIIIIAIHHLNKSSASNNVINLHSLKGSSNVVQKADKVILIKGNRDDKLRLITSVKSRDEGKFEMTATFDTNTMQFNQLRSNNG